jgi:hypothetical protein
MRTSRPIAFAGSMFALVAIALGGCAPMSARLPVAEPPPAEPAVLAHPEAASPAPVAATSKAGRAFRMLRQRDDRGGIAPDAMSRALHAREALLQPLAKTAGVARNAWMPLGPSATFGGRVNALDIDPRDPRRLLAGGATGGIWHSEDAGANWLPVNDFLASLAISGFARDAANPDVIYAGTSEYFYTATQGIGILKSIDGGTSWQRLAATDPVASHDWTYVMRIAAHPSVPGIVLAATWNGVFRSSDGGAHWNVAYSRTAFDGYATMVLDVRFNPVDPNQVIAGLEDSAVAYSGDGGFTWTTVQVAPPENKRGVGGVRLAFARTVPGLVYASIARNGGEVWKSGDAGHTWALASTPGQLDIDNSRNVIWVDPVDAQRIVVGGLDVWRSIDGGQTFAAISDWRRWPVSNHADQHAIVADPGYDGAGRTGLYVGSDGGVYRANNVLATTPTAGWSNLDNGLDAVQFWGGAASAAAGGLFVGGTQDNGTMTYKRTANQWSQWFGGDGGATAIDPSNPGILYGEYTYASVFHSLDGGGHSSYICVGITEALRDTARSAPCGAGTSGQANFIAPAVLDPNQPQRLLVGANSLWVANDARAPTPTWRAIKAPSTGTTESGDGNWISAIAVRPGNSSVVWAGHNNGELYVSSDALSAAPAWRAVAGLPARFVSRIVFDPANADRVYLAFGGFTPGNLYVTNDAGATWSNIGAALPAAPIYALAIGRRNPQLLYAGTDVGVFASEDGGRSWSTSNDGPANVPVEELSWLDDDTLVAATHGRGAFLTQTSGTAAVDVVEFYNPGLDHYFISALALEISALDSGQFPGWFRTGQSFKAYLQPRAGLSPVCRFYIPPPYGDSHFYTASQAECGVIPTRYPFFEFESPSVFYIALPDQGSGACPAGFIPIYRVWNNRADTNHRYTTSRAIRAQMVAKGYIAEGYGADAVIMCAPPGS